MADLSLAAAVAEIKANPGRFYVYVLYRPDGTPFYVGVGSVHRRDTYHRIERHEIEARSRKCDTHKVRVIRSIWASQASVGYSIDSFHEKKDQVFFRECELIASLGRVGDGTGPLVNQTKGGCGLLDPSPDVLRRMHEKIVRYWSDPESRAKHRIIKSAHGKRPEIRRLMSEAGKRRAASQPGFSSFQSEVAKAAWRDPEFRVAQILRNKLKWSDPEQRKRQAELTRKQFSDPVARAAAAARTIAQFSDPVARANAAETTRRLAAARRRLIDAVEAEIARSGRLIQLPHRRGSIRDWQKVADALGLTA